MVENNQVDGNNKLPSASATISDKQLMLELLAVLSPELTFDDTAEHLVSSLFILFKNYIIYVFLLSRFGL